MVELSKPVYMMATEAYHKLGDISRTLNDLCCVYSEDDENFYGSWVTGLGFVDVRFPKATTRRLNEDEVAYFEGKHLAAGSSYFGQIKLGGNI